MGILFLFLSENLEVGVGEFLYFQNLKVGSGDFDSFRIM